MSMDVVVDSFGKRYAELYDLFHVGKDYSEEVKQMLDGAGKWLGKQPTTVIDLACGTGRHAENFAKKGVRLQINDLSEGMLAAALKRVGNYRQLSSSCQPMQVVTRSKDLAPEGFDLAVATYTAMGYLTEPKSLNRFLKNLSHVLRPGGIFFADLWNGHRMVKDYSPHRTKTVKADNIEVTRVSNVTEVKAFNALQVRFEFLVDDQASGKRQTFEESHLVRYHTPCEIETLFDAHGMEICEMGPHMESSASLDDCWNFFVFARMR